MFASSRANALLRQARQPGSHGGDGLSDRVALPHASVWPIPRRHRPKSLRKEVDSDTYFCGWPAIRRIGGEDALGVDGFVSFNGISAPALTGSMSAKAMDATPETSLDLPGVLDVASSVDGADTAAASAALSPDAFTFAIDMADYYPAASMDETAEAETFYQIAVY